MIIDTIVRLAGAAVSGPFVVATIALVAFVTTRIATFATRRIIRRLARRNAMPGAVATGLWRPRSSRTGDESGEVREQRRRQRADAAARMVSHLISVVVWIVAVIVTFQVLAIDPAFFLSSAGFLGAALAIGGQHKVNDYLTGLSVHFEDRYGVGDEVVIDVGWDQPVRGVVDHVGLFSTRVRDRRSTLHFPNGALLNIRNLSQETPTETLHLDLPPDADAEEAAELLRGLAGTAGLTDVVFVGDLAARPSDEGGADIDVVTSRTLDDRARRRLVSRVERDLRH